MSTIQIPVTLPGFNQEYSGENLLTLPGNFPTFTVQFNSQNTLVALTNQFGITVFSPKADEWIPPECCDFVPTPEIPVIPVHEMPHWNVVPEPSYFGLLACLLLAVFITRRLR